MWVGFFQIRSTLPVQRGLGEEFVCDNSRCYFLPAKERKRQIMFFTHDAEGTGSEDQGERSVCFVEL